ESRPPWEAADGHDEDGECHPVVEVAGELEICQRGLEESHRQRRIVHDLRFTFLGTGFGIDVVVSAGSASATRTGVITCGPLSFAFCFVRFFRGAPASAELSPSQFLTGIRESRCQGQRSASHTMTWSMASIFFRPTMTRKP